MTAQLLQAKLKNCSTVKLKVTTQQSGRTSTQDRRKDRKEERKHSERDTGRGMGF